MADLHTRQLGESGSRVLFLHGLFGQGRNWTQIGKALADGEPPHQVTLLDLPHHGRSPWRDHFDYLDLAAEVAGLLEHTGPAAVVGHSMGGKVAMLVALQRPDLVERLCVVDMSPVSYRSRDVFEGLVAAMRGLDLTTLETREQADQRLAGEIPDTATRSFLLQNLRRDGDGWRWQMNLDVLGDSLGLLADWPEQELDGVAPYDGPVLWVAGADSGYVRPEFEPAMNRYFPRERLVTVKKAGHWVHSEQPAVFTEVLARFLD